MTSSEWLPAQAPFELVRRGYNPEQVTAHLERLEYELRISTANRDATNERISELTSQLQAAQAETDTLRTQLDRNALAPVSMTGLSDRMQRMIRLAEEEAAEIRARAEDDATEMRAELQSALSEHADNKQSFDAERERTRTQLAEQVKLLIAEATDEATATRTTAQQEAEQLLADANAEAQRTVSDARAAAEKTTADAAGAAERLDAESAARRTGIEEDFEIAIQARRNEAHRVITEREEQSVADANQRVAGATAEAERLISEATAEAEKRVAEATAEADRLVTTATAEAELRVTTATEHAQRTVEHAAAESHQRVGDADAAVRELSTLRARIGEQLSSLIGHLDHIRGLASSANDGIAPLAEEPNRHRVEDFPPEPGRRPTPVPGDEVPDGDAEATTVVDPSVLAAAENAASTNGSTDGLGQLEDGEDPDADSDLTDNDELDPEQTLTVSNGSARAPAKGQRRR